MSVDARVGARYTHPAPANFTGDNGHRTNRLPSDPHVIESDPAAILIFLPRASVNTQVSGFTGRAGKWESSSGHESVLLMFPARDERCWRPDGISGFSSQEEE